MKTEHGGEQVGRSFPGRLVFRIMAVLAFVGIALVVTAVVQRAMAGVDVAAAAVLGGMLVAALGVALLRLLPAFGRVLVSTTGITVQAPIGGARIEWKEITAVEVWFHNDEPTEPRLKIHGRESQQSFQIKSFYDPFNELIGLVVDQATRNGSHLQDRRPKLEA